MNLSFTLEGGLGDFILRYLGDPGSRVSSILKIANIELRVCSAQKAGHDLVYGNPFFDTSTFFQSNFGMRDRLSNDIGRILNLEEYHKLQIPLWLDPEEEEVLYGLKRPYAVFHPTASHPARSLTGVFNSQALSQWIADYSNIPVVVLGHKDFGYHSDNVIDLTQVGTSRLSCKIVEQATFFVGTHSSMQCAASVYNVPSFCIGPSHLLFHNFSAPFSFERYLKPMFFGGSTFMMFDEALHFMKFFTHFLSQATSLTPCKDLLLFRQQLLPKDKVSAVSVDF